MFFSLLPFSLALAIGPDVADLQADGGNASVSHDRAERGSRRGSSGSAQRKRSSGSSTPARRGGSRPSGGSSDGGDRRDSGSRDSDSRERGSHDSSSRDAGSRDGASRDGASRHSSEHRESGDRRESSSRESGAPRDSGAREARPGTEGARPGASRSEGARPGARPSSQPATRHMSVGDGRSPGTGPAAASAAASRHASTPANLRTSSPHGGSRPEASRGAHDSGHGSEGRHDSGDRPSSSGDRDRHDGGRADAGRSGHDRAERSDHRDYGDASRSTAERHRHAAAYSHHSRAARYASSRHAATSHHRAWVSHRARYSGRWYHPRGWFTTWAPGRPAYWYHGVFVYGPAPAYHDQVVVVHDGGGRNDGAGSASRAPVHKVDRAGDFSVGLRGGSYMGSYSTGGVYGDAGLGIAARFRPVEAVGLELAWTYHDETWAQGTERINQPIQASVQLFAMPWTKVNPYALAGVTINNRNIQDKVGPFFVDQDTPLWGPHAGVGIEFGVGEKASVNFDARYAGYLNKPEGDITRPGAFNANMGLNFYF